MGKVASFIMAALVSCWATVPAVAQTLSEIPAPPAYSSIDGNGVDLISGTLSISVPEVSIGPANGVGLSFTRLFSATEARHNLMGYIKVEGNKYTVVLGATSQVFFRNGGSTSFSPEARSGSTLYLLNGIYHYTTADGTVYKFSEKGYFLINATKYMGKISLNSISRPNGEELTFHYRTEYS